MITIAEVRDGKIVVDAPDNLREGTRVRVELHSVCDQPLSRRTGGVWNGRVVIADDFDDLPDDIASAFGANTE
jgi:hypothetical protein